MSRRRLRVGLAVATVALLGAWFGLTRFSLSALDEPSKIETYLASKGKRWLVGRSARGPLPPRPAIDAISVANGRMQYGARCASCHGLDGRMPTDFGRWMYPRTPDLGSPATQAWSDEELFWIIKNGIRLTGMPGFGKIHTDQEIWNLVDYLRSLRSQP